MKIFIGISFFLILFFSFQNETKRITRIGKSTIPGEIYKTVSQIIDFKDTIPSDTLLIHLNKNNTPVEYSRKIVVGVCVDSECRLVNIELFWNITGRYLGFELPGNEFLSKTKHNPFNEAEYNRLHSLLADPFSALANYSLNELVPETDSSKTYIDAVSSATISAVLDYIVEGAVYTTYTLWHIIYGSTKHEIEKLTIKNLNSELVLKILESDNFEDRIWVLNHIPNKMEITSALQTNLLAIISGSDIYLAERSLNTLNPEDLTDSIQIKLMAIFSNTDFLRKRMIINKLKEAPKLASDVVLNLSSELETMNGSLVKSTLELLKQHNINSEVVVIQIAELLNSENRYIAKQAFNYLKEMDNLNKKTLKKIDKYKRKRV